LDIEKKYHIMSYTCNAVIDDNIIDKNVLPLDLGYGSDHTSRLPQVLFVCHACGYQCKAHLNGDINLGNMLSHYMWKSGTVGF
jgi:hypothetical protein